jgi:hypothetical protein
MSRKSFQSAANRAGGPIEFDIDGEVFYASPVMPADLVLSLGDLATESNQGKRAQAAMAILDSVLLPESATRFADRMKGGEHPITVLDATGVINWLVSEHYAPARPTGGASPSQPGSSTPGTPSTDGAPPEGSTPSL